MNDINVTGNADYDMRACIAYLRHALSESLKGENLNAARLLNETTDIAQAYQCYALDGEIGGKKARQKNRS